jgi:uncharacterized protein YwgA
MEDSPKLPFPTEVIDLPSRGLLYPESNPLSSGQIEMRYMTAQHEDILTNQSYIQKGIVLDKLMQALIVSKINYEDLIVGDINAIMVAARVLGYGKDYSFYFEGSPYSVDLSKIDNKVFDEKLITKGSNEFKYIFPATKTEITFKILTKGDEIKIFQEIEGLKKIKPLETPELSTRLKFIITSVGGNREPGVIRKFVENELLARDSRALREYIKEIQPDVNLTFFPQGSDKPSPIPVGIKFFWPDAE